MLCEILQQWKMLKFCSPVVACGMVHPPFRPFIHASMQLFIRASLPPCICSSLHLCILATIHPCICHFWSCTSDHNCKQISLEAPKNLFFTWKNPTNPTIFPLAWPHTQQLSTSPPRMMGKCASPPQMISVLGTTAA